MPDNQQIRTIIVKKPNLTSSSCISSRLPKQLAHSCPYCSKLFSSPSHLSRHILIHTGEKPCLCSECGQQFSQISSLERHQRTKHEKYKSPSILNSTNSYQCKLCNEYFSLKHNLKMHEKKLHQIVTNFYCQICSAYFTCNSSLQKHRNFRHRLLLNNNNDQTTYLQTDNSQVFETNKLLLEQQQVHYQILKCNEID